MATREEAEALPGYGSGSMDWLKSPARLEKEYGSTRKDLQAKAEQDAASAALNNQKAAELGMQNQFSQEALAPIMAELQVLKSKDIYSRTTQVVDASLKDGKYEDAWNGFLSDPSVKELYKGMNVQSVQTFNPANEAHVRAYRQSGMPEEVLNYLVKGPDTNIVPANENGKVVLNEQKVTPEDLKAIAMAYPLVQGLDNSIRVQPLGDFMASTGILKGVLSATDKQRYLDVVDQGINTLGKVAQGSYKSKLAKESAETSKLTAEAGKVTSETNQLDFVNKLLDPKNTDTANMSPEDKYMQFLKYTKPEQYKQMSEMNNKNFTEKVQRDPNALINAISNKDTTIDNKVVKPKEAADMIQGTNNPSDTAITKITGGLNALTNVKSATAKLAGIDKNAWSKVKDSLTKVTGTAFFNMDGKEAGNFVNRLQVGTDIKLLIADIVKAYNGSSSSDNEKATMYDTLIGGDWSTKETTTATLNAFEENLVRNGKTEWSVLARTFPRSYIDLKDLKDTNGVHPNEDKTNTTHAKGYTSKAGKFFPEGTRLGDFVIQNGVPVQVKVR